VYSVDPQIVLFALSVIAIGLAVLVPVLPWLNRLPVFPQAAMMSACLPFGLGELPDRLVLGMVPTVAFLNLVDVDVMVADIKSATVTSLAVDFDRVEADVFSVNLFLEAFPRRRPIRLPVFRRVDSVQIDAMPAARFVQNGACVSVFDGDNPPADRSAFIALFVPAFVATFIVPVICPEHARKTKQQGKSNQGS